MATVVATVRELAQCVGGVVVIPGESAHRLSIEVRQLMQHQVRPSGVARYRPSVDLVALLGALHAAAARHGDGVRGDVRGMSAMDGVRTTSLASVVSDHGDPDTGFGVMGTADAARLLGVSGMTVRRWTRDGQIRGRRERVRLDGQRATCWQWVINSESVRAHRLAVAAEQNEVA